MAVLPIIIAPDPVLKKTAAPVGEITDRHRALLDDMLETMYKAPGIGLAATQIGVLERLVVVDCAGKDEAPQPHKLVNPELVWTSDEREEGEEGCLSLPDIYGMVTRPTACRVRYRDQDGADRTLDASGLLAVCLQHEIDHLNGVLFIDHLSSLKRNMILRKLQKLKKSKAA